MIFFCLAMGVKFKTSSIIMSTFALSVGACYQLPMVRGSPNPLHFGLPARLRKTRKQSGQKRLVLGHKVGS